MTLKVEEASTVIGDQTSKATGIDPADCPEPDAGALPDDARPLLDATLAELTAWSPSELLGAFRRMHHSALSLIHLNVLGVLAADGPQSMSRLARALDVSVASATGIVDRMEHRGLVARRRAEDDRRVVLVEITDAGRQIFSDIDERQRTGLAALLARLSDDELRGLLVGHQALRAARRAALAERDRQQATATG